MKYFKEIARQMMHSSILLVNKRDKKLLAVATKLK